MYAQFSLIKGDPGSPHKKWFKKTIENIKMQLI